MSAHKVDSDAESVDFGLCASTRLRLNGEAGHDITKGSVVVCVKYCSELIHIRAGAREAQGRQGGRERLHGHRIESVVAATGVRCITPYPWCQPRG